MSQWTRVCGCIRVDAIRGIIGDTPETLRIKLGKIVRYEDEDYETTLPCGSEGSIQYDIIVNPDKEDLAAYVVPIWGDLRSYSNVEEIKNWFNGVCDSIGMIRDAVISIDVEFGTQEVVRYKKD